MPCTTTRGKVGALGGAGLLPSLFHEAPWLRCRLWMLKGGGKAALWSQEEQVLLEHRGEATGAATGGAKNMESARGGIPGM